MNTESQVPLVAPSAQRSGSTASLWAVSTIALLLLALLHLFGCEPAAPQPIDAGAPAVLDMSAPQLPDLMPVAPACVPCSWTAPYTGCDPSLCARMPGGQLCCRPRRQNGRRHWRKRARARNRQGPLHFYQTPDHDVKVPWSGKWMRRHFQRAPQPPTAQNPTFAPTSLVGMSQSARKRAARFWPCPGCVECGSSIEESCRSPNRCDGGRLDLFAPDMWGRSKESVASCRQEWLRLWSEQWRKYRIGQRLTTCGYGCVDGCEECYGGVVEADDRGARSRRRRYFRQRKRMLVAMERQTAESCTHPTDEWIGAGRKCPSQDERGICNGIPF